MLYGLLKSICCHGALRACDPSKNVTTSNGDLFDKIHCHKARSSPSSWPEVRAQRSRLQQWRAAPSEPKQGQMDPSLASYLSMHAGRSEQAELIARAGWHLPSPFSPSTMLIYACALT
jgi:hypothetical protein